MKKKPVVTSVQLILMSVGSSLVFPYTFMPILNTPPYNQDVWIVLLVSMVYLVVLNLPILFLANKFRNLSITETTEMVMGKTFGKIILIPICLFCMFCFIACMLMTAIFISLYVFRDTPTWSLVIVMALSATLAAYKGAGIVSRLASFLVPIAILVVVFFFIISISEMDFSILQPVLRESSFLDINKGAFLTAMRFSEILIFWIFSFFLMKKKSINKSYFTSVLIFGMVFMLMLISTVAILGIGYAQRVWNPYFTFTRQIQLFDSVERMQAINIMAWFPCALLKLAIYNFMASYLLSLVFKAKSHKKFTIPLSFIAFIACVIPIMDKSSTVEILRSDQVFPFFILPATLGVPIIIVIVYLFRRKKINLILKDFAEDAAG